jgi:transcriptional regulator with XRE-family HTH domain
MPETHSHRPAEPIHLSEAVAANLRRLRRLRRLSQEDVAERMTALGYGRPGKPGGRADTRARGWGRSTVSEAESGKRELTVDELFGLSIIFGVTPPELLNPGESDLSLGTVAAQEQLRDQLLPPRLVRAFLRSNIALGMTEAYEAALEAGIEDPAEVLRGKFVLTIAPVDGRMNEYIEALGLPVSGGPANETKED